MNEAQKQYNALLESGELQDMFPSFKCEWEKDKKAFIKFFEENQKILNTDSLDLDDEEVYDYGDY